MKLPIENWVAERHYSQNVIQLFNESVICYRNGAYRASLLLSYLGMLTIVKETMLQSLSASGFTPVEWNEKIKLITNHEKWEESVFDSLVQVKKPIFRLSDDMRTQLQFWRGRRNDAAHFKDNEIDGPHTEALWSFIKSNIPKMAVDGGMAGLLNKFVDHFDDEKTDPGSGVQPLVREIPTSVLETELPAFFAELQSRLDSSIWSFKTNSVSVFNEVFNLANEKIASALAKYLKDNRRDLHFLNYYPARLMLIEYLSSEMRLLWKKRIWENTAINPIAIYCELVNHNKIPHEELESVHGNLYRLYNQRSRRFLPSTIFEIQILNQSGFFDYLYNKAVVQEKLKWVKEVNSKCDLIALMIEHYPLNVETVKTVCALGNGNYGSNWLIDAIARIFAEKPLIKANFNSIADTNSFDVPFALAK